MKKTGIIAILVLIGVLIFTTGASAYIVGWLNQAFEVKEPIVVTIKQAPTGPVWPGGNFVVGYGVSNQADVYYGMAYGGYIVYVDASGKAVKFQLEKQPTKDKEPSIRLLQKPEGLTTTGGGPSFSWGQVSFELTINGKTQSYSPGEIVNIEPGSSQALSAKIRPSAEIPPGKWEFYLMVDRNEPNKHTVPAPQ